MIYSAEPGLRRVFFYPQVIDLYTVFCYNKMLWGIVMNRSDFEKACSLVIGQERQRNGIGTLGEKTLHAVLKNYFEPHPENHEIRVGRFVADIVCENGVIEIQTRSFNRLLVKLENFLEYCNVTVVYPIPEIKYLSWIDMQTGEVTKHRKSPKKGTIYDCAAELYRIKYTLDNPRMCLCLCMLTVEETRYLNGWSRDGKRGSTRCDRVPTALNDEIWLRCPSDYSMFIPEGLDEDYTSSDFASAAHISLKTAQTLLNLLTYLGVVERISKRSNSFVYRTVN